MSTTNRKRAARDIAAREGITYQQALARILNAENTNTTSAPTYPLLSEDWAGAMQDGYTDDTIEDFFSHVLDTTGVELVCVWGYYDEWGFGGDSNWYVVDRTDGEAVLYELEGDLWEWAFEPYDAEVLATHGDPASWKGSKADFGDNPPQEWSGYNWPIEFNDGQDEDDEDAA